MAVSKIQSMSRKLRNGDTSSQELTAQALERANQINDTIRAFEFVDEDLALEEFDLQIKDDDGNWIKPTMYE